MDGAHQLIQHAPRARAPTPHGIGWERRSRSDRENGDPLTAVQTTPSRRRTSDVVRCRSPRSSWSRAPWRQSPSPSRRRRRPVQPTGPRCTPATSLTRASWSGWASTTASPPRTSLRRATRSTSRCRPRPTASIGTSRTASTRCPPSARGPSPATPGLPASCVTTPTTTSSCTTRRRRSRPAISASAWPRLPCPRAPTPTTRRNPSSVRTGSATAIRPWTAAQTTAAASTRTSSPICPDRIWLDLEERRRPLTPPVPTVMWSVPLGPHFFPTSTTPTALMQDDEAWQSGIIEGPDMFETTTGTGTNTTDVYTSSIRAATRALRPTPSAGPAALPVRLAPAPTSRRPDHC